MAANDDTYTGAADGSGVAVVTIRTVGRQTWLVQQIGVTVSPLPTAATCSVKKNGVLVCPIVLIGDGGAAGGDPPVRIAPGDVLTVEFSGLAAAQPVTVLIIYNDGT